MPKEIYQIQPLKDNSLESLTVLVEELNIRLFEISKRLSDIAIPQTGITTSTSLADLITALTSAGIVSEE